MASPPFDINQSLPGDSDIVSQFPAVERTYRDVVESWFLLEHNVQGRHDQTRIDWHADASYAGIASVTSVWASSDDLGDLHKRQGTNAIEWVGVPPGNVSARFDASIPNGWTACDGGTLSRTVAGARLFALWGTTFGIGDGSTTFNKPTCTGKVLVGVDAGQTNVAGFTTIGTSAGSKNATISQAMLPNVSFTNSGIGLLDPGHSHFTVKSGSSGSCGGLDSNHSMINSACAGGDGSFAMTNAGSSGNTADTGLSSANGTSISISSQGAAASGGSGAGLPLAQAGIAVNYVIKL